MEASEEPAHGILYIVDPVSSRTYYLYASLQEDLNQAWLHYMLRGFQAATYNMSSNEWSETYGGLRPTMPVPRELLQPALLSPVLEAPLPSLAVTPFALLGQFASDIGSVGRNLLSGSPAQAPALAHGSLSLGAKPIYISIYVNNFVFFSKDPTQQATFCARLNKKITVDWIGDAEWFLGTSFE